MVSPTSVRQLHGSFKELGDQKVAEHSQRFFRTGKGEYGEGDRFLGIRVPAIRRLVKQQRNLRLQAIDSFLHSHWHEERLFAVLWLADSYQRGDMATRIAVYRIYTANLDFVNNWDLVDGSAHLIVGPHLEQRSRKPLYRWSRSNNLWHRRVAIMATFHFIRNQDFEDTLAIAERLLTDDEDLIHKATGWMLREVGNRARPVEEAFLMQHYQRMPRTMLRYAIEKFPERRRKAYLHGKV